MGLQTGDAQWGSSEDGKRLDLYFCPRRPIIIFERTIEIPAMWLRIKLGAISARKVLKVLLSFSLLLCVVSMMAVGQAASSNAPEEFYGGIEISPEGVKAIALRVPQNQDDAGFKLVYSDVIRLALWRTSSGGFAPQATMEAAQAVMTLLARLRQQYRVPLERIYFIGSSRLGGGHPADLVSAI